MAKKRTRLPLSVLVGIVLVVIGVLVVGLTFYPVVWVEFGYRFRGPGTKVAILREATSSASVLYPVDEDFGIVIPKIEANAKVIANVDPFDSRVYQSALTRGVAQAKGSALPDSPTGNVFIFSHSSANFYEATMFNSVFYLLDKLEKDDEIDLFYKKEKYAYKVTTKKIVPATEVSYLSGKSTKKTVTLMTCWPAGTSFKRLIVVAEAVD